MTSNGKVISINKNTITLQMFRESSCAHCNGCGDASKMARELEIKYKGDVEIGDVVTFELADSKMLKIGFIIYILPILIMIFGYFISAKLGGKEKLNVLVSFLSLVISFACIHIYDKYFVKEKVQMNVLKVEKPNDIEIISSCESSK